MKIERVQDASLQILPQPPPRFTLNEWYLNNRFRERICLDQQCLADHILTECDRIIDHAAERTLHNKKEADHAIAQRIRDIEYYRNENLKRREAICTELDSILTYVERMVACWNSIKEKPTNICRTCLILREGRLGIDLCYDDVEKELCKELEVIEGGKSMLSRTLEQANEQIRRLRSVSYFLDRDLQDKDKNLENDARNSILTNTSLNLSMYHGFTPLNQSNITIEEWEDYSREVTAKAEKEVNSARHLRSFIDTILRQCINDLRNQANIVNEAFRQRISETKDIKTKLEVQHSEISRQANEMNHKITQLEKAMAEKEGYMALAHTRLGNRAQRPGAELCQDIVERVLSNEVYEMRPNLVQLQQILAECQASLRYLLKTQIQLEEDINIKTNTLKIDEVDCMTLRESVVYQDY